jgi:hypothetical protein
MDLERGSLQEKCGSKFMKITKYKINKKDILCDEAIIVWGVVDKDNQVLSEQLPFYFQRDFAISATKQMNESFSKEGKPYKVKKALLLYFKN